MANVAANKRLTVASFQFDTDTYTEHVLSYAFVPTTATASYTDVGGTTHHLGGESSFELQLELLQDYSATGLAREVFDNEGDEVTVSIIDGPTTWTATITLVAGQIGSAGKTIPTTQVSFPSTRPVPTASA